MNTTLKKVFGLIICLAWSLLSYAQDCVPPNTGAIEFVGGKVIVSYGATTNSVTPTRASNILVGQAAVGQSNTTKLVSDYGFYTQFLLPPLPPSVFASQGELLDRIQVSWSLDPLGSSPNEGFNLFRDDVFIANVGPKVRNYNDFNVIAGRPYIYSVSGINKFGEGSTGEGLGFQVPNGVVTGWIQTPTGRPVPDVQVTLLPMQGFSANFANDNGAVAINDTGNPFLPNLGQDWSMSFWLNNTTSGGTADIIHFSGASLKINALPGADGISVSYGGASTTANFPANEWHHLTLAHEGGSSTARLYLDGALVDQVITTNIGNPDSLYFGQVLASNDWSGKIDEFRIYHTLLDQLDLDMVSSGTASSTTENLTHYWKFDEELGEKSFDIMNRHELFFCGTQFDEDRPPVKTAGISDQDGFYLIEGVSYGTGTTFKAEAEKDFYLRRSLDFNSSEGDFISIPAFALPPQATLELVVNNTNAGAAQTILSKEEGGNTFKIFSELNGSNNELKVAINGNTQAFGTLPMGYNHLAFTIDSLTGQIQSYINGAVANAHTFTITGNWSDTTSQWYVGAMSMGGSTSEFYNGLIDEWAIYNSKLPAATIADHAQNPREITESGLYIYFPMDEGNGNRINNVGSNFIGFGLMQGPEWSNFAANQETTPHEFSPGTRQVTLNPSVTSVDQVDFTDLSTVPVSGYVRYENTDCFAPNVEILVNGASFSPNVYTDSLGKFVIEFDPGTSAILTPKFEDHTFVPASWEVIGVNSPIAGILFNDVTTRTVSGQVAGGECKKSIITAPPGTGQGTVCRVEVRSTDGCLIRTKTIDNQEGNFEFTGLPPLESMTVAVVEHSNDLIKSAFQVQGGSTVDISKADTIVDFIYTAPPEIEISGLEFVPNCPDDIILLSKGDTKTIDIRVKETYVATPSDDGVCYLDTANIEIINGLADVTLDTVMSGGTLEHMFRVGNPNPSPPHLKTLQVIATSIPGGQIGSDTKQAIVTGTLNKLQTFTTMMPMMPSLILRDPPGDGSSSFIERTERICKTTELGMEVDAGVGTTIDIEVAPTINFVVAPFGLGKVVTVDPDFQVNTEFEITYSKKTSSSFETCVSFDRKISTSGDDAIVGGEQGGDLYMGEAINLIFGFADKVSFDTCQVAVEEILLVEPGDFATSFIYSEFNIKNTVLRYLEDLANSPDADSTSKANYLESIARWQAILARNDTLKQEAELIRNLSFDAGVSYEYSETADTTSTSSNEDGVNTDSKIGTTFGLSLDNIGVSTKINAIVKSSNTWKTEDGTSKGLTTGYTLSDDDPGDAFTVDVAMDSVYKTPVFRIKAGQSSCPWEPGTANREAPNLNLAEGGQFTAVNIPSNEPAVFNFNLGNLSATNEDFTYGLTVMPGSNPDGAIVRLNGQPLNGNTIKYLVPFGTSIPVTVTVERGPVAYEYSEIEIAFVSECEMERNYGLGIALDNDPKFFSSIKLGVDFIRPCSEVKVTFPEQNWTVINDDPNNPGTLRRITVSGYDLNSPEFQLVRVQYRKSDGNGAWINLPAPNNIYEAYNPNWTGFSQTPNSPDSLLLGPSFTQFFWETAGLEDGDYEIHAWAVCSGDASDKPGFSQIIKGRIDRQPPSLLGFPQPSDGVYHVGDEISFTFNQDVDCTKLIQADQMNANNVGLYDATTGNLIDANISCFGNKIIIDPIFQNKFFENKILRVELHDIKDLVGNNMVYEDWEFYVDRNELAWLTDSIELTKYDDESKTITAKIHNRGGYPVPYTMHNIPEWLHVSPDAGTLVANEIEEINFTVDETVALGWFSDSIIMRTETGVNPFFMGGDEVLNMAARVICRPDRWIINPEGFDPSGFSFSMNYSLELNIEGVVSNDVQDMVGAYVNGQLRGVARLQYNPELNNYLAFLTVYSNVASGETVEFQIWDASECKLFAQILESFPFQADNIIGSPDVPQTINTDGKVLRKIFIHPGWNWISLNVNLVDPNTSAALSTLTNPAGALIKGQSDFSAYSLFAQQWIGVLDSLRPIDMYQYNSLAFDSLSIVGSVLDPNTEIPLVAGWNWIGYIPNEKLAIEAALSGLAPTNGDIIKSQISFAQYVDNIGWIGNLDFLDAPNGYLIKMNSADTLIYPDPQNIIGQGSSPNRWVPRGGSGITLLDQVKASKLLSSQWDVDPAQFEHNMNIIAIVRNYNSLDNILDEGDEVGAFVGEEVRGSSEVTYIPALDAYMLFLTVYAQQEGELLTFKYYDASEGEIHDIEESTGFIINSIVGEVDDPEPFNIKSVTSIENEILPPGAMAIYPNPFSTSVFIDFHATSSRDDRVLIFDAMNRLVDRLDVKVHPGLNTFEWTPGPMLSTGTYFINLEGNAPTKIQRVLYIK